MNGKLKLARIRVTNFSYMQRLSLHMNKFIGNQIRNWCCRENSGQIFKVRLFVQLFSWLHPNNLSWKNDVLDFRAHIWLFVSYPTEVCHELGFIFQSVIISNRERLNIFVFLFFINKSNLENFDNYYLK